MARNIDSIFLFYFSLERAVCIKEKKKKENRKNHFNPGPKTGPASGQ
jgi:hypothetical protein